MKLYNTLTRKKEKFKPLRDKQVGIYVCGPTVYDYDHLGHARTFVFFDVLRQFLKFLGYKVKFIQNITDVGHLVGDNEEGEDKLGKQAQKEKISPQAVAEKYTKAHFEDMALLNVKKPDVSPRASDHIPEIIGLIKKLEKAGLTYIKKGNVFFKVVEFEKQGGKYGILSRRKAEEQKSNKQDFVLWRTGQGRNIQIWDSPWGRGFPGWHIECSAMAHKYLGDQFEIHGSASEHIFPHHENEIAQSKAGYGKIPARFWIHTGLLSVNGQKMSKSKGNQINIRQIIKKHPPEVIRLALLSTYYRKPINFTYQLVEQYRKVYQKLVLAFRQAQDSPRPSSIYQEIVKALKDYMNIPLAISLLEQGAKKLSKKEFAQVSQILGLTFQPKKTILTQQQKEMIERREKFRQQKKYHRADELRQKLEKQGVKVKDTPTGSKVEEKI